MKRLVRFAVWINTLWTEPHMNDFLRAALPGFLLFAALPGHTGPLPLWEVGAGVAVASLPDYRGSDVRNTYFLPAPYLIYRGQIFKADREGVRAAFYESDRLEINLSLNVGLAYGNKDNPLRRGMEALRPTLETGPTADVKLWRSADGKSVVDLRLPLRAAFTLSSSPRQVGWLFSPNLHWSVRDSGLAPGWKLSAQAGPIFATRSHHAYFYSVSPEEALPRRPAYAAPGGYSGTQIAAILSKRFSRYWVGAYMRYDNLNGAVFADSPLVQRRSSLATGVAVAWVFGTSGTMVDTEE
jgi:outer membrane scaffolding protein for murein synthesis (MipA/OmpV family)